MPSCKTTARRRGAADDAFGAHAGFGESEVERIFAATRQFAIHVDQVLHAADFRAEDDLLGAHSVADGELGGTERALHHGFHGDVAGVFGFVELGVLVHEAGEELRVERAPVHADADGLVVLDGDFDHGAEVVVVFLADGDVAGINAVLRQRLGAVGKLLEQEVSVVVEVADDGHANAEAVEAVNDGSDGGSGSVVVHGDADEFGAGASKGRDLADGAFNVGRVGVGHGLHHNWCIAAHADASDGGRVRLSALYLSHTGRVQFTMFGLRIDGWNRPARDARRFVEFIASII